jgi:competence protein ComEC
MLAVKPGLILDISFQLSFIAVAAIISWFRPIYSLIESRWRGLNALWAMLIVGFTASVATMPLVSHTFGVISPAGIVLNPIVILTAHFVVVFSLLWIIAPIPFLEPVFRWLVGGPAWLQNTVIEKVASVPGTAIEWTMPLWMVLTIYAGMVIFTAWLASRPRRVEPFVLMR